MGFKVVLSSESAFQAIVWMNEHALRESFVTDHGDHNYKYGGSVPEDASQHVFVFENRDLAMRVKLMFGGR
jgi:hypothetical protein